MLQAYAWPGNVRELRNVIERALITSGDGPLRLERVLPEAATAAMPAHAADERPAVIDERRLRKIERDNMIAALEQTDWRVGGDNGAASLIGISPSTFKSRMKALGIERPR
jgi:transcriptional regulator of acetoin/glycerol metabolism